MTDSNDAAPEDAAPDNEALIDTLDDDAPNSPAFLAKEAAADIHFVLATPRGETLAYTPPTRYVLPVADLAKLPPTFALGRAFCDVQWPYAEDVAEDPARLAKFQADIVAAGKRAADAHPGMADQAAEYVARFTRSDMPFQNRPKVSVKKAAKKADAAKAREKLAIIQATQRKRKRLASQGVE